MKSSYCSTSTQPLVDEKSLPPLTCYWRIVVCWAWVCFLKELSSDAQKDQRAVDLHYSSNPSVTVSCSVFSPRISPLVICFVLFFLSCGIMKNCFLNSFADYYLQIKEAHNSCLKFSSDLSLGTPMAVNQITQDTSYTEVVPEEAVFMLK